MPTFHRYEDLETYLRDFANFGGGPVPYDFVGVLHLMLALLDNLRINAPEGQLEDIHEVLTDEQAAFFLKLAEYLRRHRMT